MYRWRDLWVQLTWGLLPTKSASSDEPFYSELNHVTWTNPRLFGVVYLLCVYQRGTNVVVGLFQPSSMCGWRNVRVYIWRIFWLVRLLFKTEFGRRGDKCLPDKTRSSLCYISPLKDSYISWDYGENTQIVKYFLILAVVTSRLSACQPASVYVHDSLSVPLVLLLSIVPHHTPLKFFLLIGLVTKLLDRTVSRPSSRTPFQNSTSSF